jgi:hypothetical protein
VLAQTPQKDQARSWIKEWTEARRSAAQIDQRLLEAHAAIVEAHERAGFSDTPSLPQVNWPTSGDERANRYCATLASVENNFFDKLRNVLEIQEAHTSALGAQPLRTLEAVWGFAALSQLERLVELGEDADRSRDLLLPIQHWMDPRAGRPVGPEEMRRAPVAGLREAAERSDRLWRELFFAIEHLAPQISEWRRFEDEETEPILSDLAWQQNQAVLLRQEYGDDFRSWRESEDHVYMEDLVRLIAEVYPRLKARRDAASN